jgi:LacI family transcriptional regulator
VNGVLIFDSCCNASLLGALTEQNLPVMLVNAEAPDTSSVAVDHTSGLSSVLRHLVDLGHHRIAFIDDPDGPLAGAYLDRGRSAYSAALRGVRLARRAYYERTADGGSQAASVVLDELLDLPERPTAVVVGSDRHALAIIDTMRRVGLRVPQDLCIVGYGDSAAAVYFGLTTIQLPLQAVGTQAAILLLRAVADAQVPPVTIRLTPELVVRGTCGVRSQAKGQPDGPSGRDVMVTAVACSTRPA